MNILGLPGVKFETQKWMHDLLSEMHASPFDFQVAQYRHWSDDQDPDVNFEASCPECDMVYGVTPCSADNPANVKAAGIGF